MKFLTPFLFALLLTSNLGAQFSIELENFASGFSSTVDLANAGDDRLFVVEQGGRIKVVDENGNTLSNNFLNIQNKISSGNGEQGLLGLAFHPNYANNGYFYVNYTAGNLNTRVSRFSVDANNPNIADPNSEIVLLEFNQPFDNHNGGDIAFGPDGYLYIGTGDGGSGGDPQGNSQNRQNLLGKLLRLDVTTNFSAYTIPAENPFVNDATTLDEIWAFGIRNPWRWSFDKLTGDIWMGDVGQNTREEINFQPTNSTGGENYGWNCREGFIAFNNPASACSGVTNFTEPVFDYQTGSNAGCSVTGGIRYRGCEYPALYGKYVFSDFCSGRFWTTDESDGEFVTEVALESGLNISGFGEDVNNELYVLQLSGTIYRVVSGDPAEVTIEIVNDADALMGSTNFNVSEYQWMLDEEPIDGANEILYTATQSGNYSLMVTTQNGCTYSSESFMLVISSVDDLAGLKEFSVFPLPFDQQLNYNVLFETPTEAMVSLFDQNGKIIQEKQFARTATLNDQLSTADLPSGIYLLRIKTEKGAAVKKVIRF